MKPLKYIGLALAAFSCAQLAVAQEAPKLQAYVVVPGSKKVEALKIERGDGNGAFYYLQKGTDQLLSAPASSCKVFYLVPPAEMTSALNDYYGGETADARKAFASIKKKYAAFAGLPGSPATQAALNEMTCAARMCDLPAVKTLAAEIPGAKALNACETARVAAAKVLGESGDTPDAQAKVKAALDELSKDKATLRNMDTESYGWLCYAEARAMAAQIPADQLAATIAADKAKIASEAVDKYCQAVMSMHGAHKGMPADALNRAMTILWAMPGVKDEAAKAAKPMDKKAWAKANADFREAVAMAHYLKTLYPPTAKEPNALADQLDAYYCNALEGVKKGGE
jgi:hypothetical protein